jgi:hypothetical protein
MSKEYLLSGALFKNTDKKTPNHPDYGGSLKDENGKEYWLSGWLKEGRKGRFISLALKEKEDQKPQQQAPVNHPEDLSDEVPF